MSKIKFTFESPHPHWVQGLSRTYVRRSEDVRDAFWTSYMRSIYVLCPVNVLYALNLRAVSSDSDVFFCSIK